MAILQLNDEEKTQGAWKKTREFLEASRDALREQNDNLGLSVERTAAIRGKIQLINEMLSVDSRDKPHFAPVSHKP